MHEINNVICALEGDDRNYFKEGHKHPARQGRTACLRQYLEAGDCFDSRFLTPLSLRSK
jgi:hypothetical protein